jgi:hypothetical protein
VAKKGVANLHWMQRVPKSMKIKGLDAHTPAWGILKEGASGVHRDRGPRFVLKAETSVSES